MFSEQQMEQYRAWKQAYLAQEEAWNKYVKSIGSQEEEGPFRQWQAAYRDAGQAWDNIDWGEHAEMVDHMLPSEIIEWMENL